MPVVGAEGNQTCVECNVLKLPSTEKDSDPCTES